MSPQMSSLFCLKPSWSSVFLQLQYKDNMQYTIHLWLLFLTLSTIISYLYSLPFYFYLNILLLFSLTALYSRFSLPISFPVFLSDFDSFFLSSLFLCLSLFSSSLSFSAFSNFSPSLYHVDSPFLLLVFSFLNLFHSLRYFLFLSSSLLASDCSKSYKYTVVTSCWKCM